MRCRTCDYSLWNLPTRTCPECGTDFRPSDFDFVPNTVRFCCPRCDQPYYGTDERGHLVPRAFDCIGCGCALDIDETVLRPAEGVDESKTAAAEMPWLQPGARGRVRRWWDTCKMAMVRPGELGKGTPSGSPLGSAWKFCLINLGIVFGASAVLMISLLGVGVWIAGTAMSGTPGGGGTGMTAMGLATMLGMQLVQHLVIFLFAILWLLVAMLVTHGILKLGGRPKHTMRATFQAWLYSSGAYILGLVPCIGGLAGIWWFVSAILMLRRTQEVSGGRATLGVLAFPVLSTLVVVGGYIALIMMLVSASAPGARVNLAGRESSHLAFSLRRSAMDNDDAPGFGPAHPALLMQDGTMFSGIFTHADSDTNPDDVPLGRGTLADIGDDFSAARDAAELAANDLPDRVVAVRLGDYVFTYFGIDFDAAHPPLWTVICWPEPGADQFEPYWGVEVGSTDGGTTVIGLKNFDAALIHQNELRADAGLPPLVHPSDVTHDEPAVGP